jgi:hypothetical protein
MIQSRLIESKGKNTVFLGLYSNKSARIADKGICLRMKTPII